MAEDKPVPDELPRVYILSTDEREPMGDIPASSSVHVLVPPASAPRVEVDRVRELFAGLRAAYAQAVALGDLARAGQVKAEFDALFRRYAGYGPDEDAPPGQQVDLAPGATEVLLFPNRMQAVTFGSTESPEVRKVRMRVRPDEKRRGR